MQRQLDACPFTIRQVNKTTYLIRELDRFVSQTIQLQLSDTPNIGRMNILTST